MLYCRYLDELKASEHFFQQILAIGTFPVLLSEPLQLRRIDKAKPIGDLLGAGNLEALATLQCRDEFRGVEQAIRRTVSSQAKPRPIFSTFNRPRSR